MGRSRRPRTDSSVTHALGARLRALRIRRGLSQAELAELAGLSLNAIGSFERGQRFPRASSIEALLQALGEEPGHMGEGLVAAAREPSQAYLEGLGLPVHILDLVRLLWHRSETECRLIRDLAARLLEELDRQPR